MTNLMNSTENSSKVRATSLFAAQRILTDHYPHTAKLFDDPGLLERLERRFACSGIGWIEACLTGNDRQQTCFGHYDNLKIVCSESFLHQLDEILDDPKGCYDTLRELVTGFDFGDYSGMRATNIIAYVENLRSLLLEAYLNRQRQH